MDVSENNLRRRKKALVQEASGDRLNADERAELARLRRENKDLRMEKEILKMYGLARLRKVKVLMASSAFAPMYSACEMSFSTGCA